MLPIVVLAVPRLQVTVEAMATGSRWDVARLARYARPAAEKAGLWRVAKATSKAELEANKLQASIRHLSEAIKAARGGAVSIRSLVIPMTFPINFAR